MPKLRGKLQGISKKSLVLLAYFFALYLELYFFPFDFVGKLTCKRSETRHPRVETLYSPPGHKRYKVFLTFIKPAISNLLAPCIGYELFSQSHVSSTLARNGVVCHHH